MGAPTSTAWRGERRIDLWRRTARGWTQLTFPEGRTVDLESVECELSVDAVYREPLVLDPKR